MSWKHAAAPAPPSPGGCAPSPVSTSTPSKKNFSSTPRPRTSAAPGWTTSRPAGAAFATARSPSGSPRACRPPAPAHHQPASNARSAHLHRPSRPCADATRAPHNQESRYSFAAGDSFLAHLTRSSTARSRPRCVRQGSQLDMAASRHRQFDWHGYPADWDKPGSPWGHPDRLGDLRTSTVQCPPPDLCADRCPASSWRGAVRPPVMTRAPGSQRALAFGETLRQPH